MLPLTDLYTPTPDHLPDHPNQYITDMYVHVCLNVKVHAHVHVQWPSLSLGTHYSLWAKASCSVVTRNPKACENGFNELEYKL